MTEIQNFQTEEYVEYDELAARERGGWQDKIGHYLDNKYFVPATLILVAIISFALGRVSGLEEGREPVRIINSSQNNPLNPRPNATGGQAPYIKGETETSQSPGEVNGASVQTDSGQAQPSQNATAGTVVASKNGTKYHYPWCAGAKQISEKNKITFESIEAARAKGYSPASNCQGLK